MTPLASGRASTAQGGSTLGVLSLPASVFAIPPEVAESLRVAAARITTAFGDTEALAAALGPATEAVRRQCEEFSRTFEASR